MTYNIRKKVLAMSLMGIMTATAIAGCSTTGARDAAQQSTASSDSSESSDKSTDNSTDNSTDKSTDKSSSSDSSAAVIDTSAMFTDRDLESAYDNTSTSTITLKDNGSTSDSKNVEIKDNVITIKAVGTYIVSGKLSDGQIVVEAGDQDKVEIVLNGVSITSKNSAAIFSKTADKVFITTAKGTKNTLTTAGEFQNSDDTNIDGTIFSKTDLVLKGEGSLTVTDNYGHGIVCKDDLKITSGTLKVTAKKKGLQGKDSIRITTAKINIDAGTEGMEGTIIYMKDGTVNLKAEDDGLNAANSDNNNDGMQADNSTAIQIDGGKLTIDAGGDGIDTNGTLTVNGGETYISGPTSNKDGAIDCAGGSTITGGTFIAAGASGMAENFGSDSTQGSILVSFDSAQTGETALKDKNGTKLASYTPTKEYGSVVISVKDIEKNGTYTVTAGKESQEIEMGDSLIYGETKGGMGGHGGGMGGKPDGNMTPPDGSSGNGPDGKMTPPDGNSSDGSDHMGPPHGKGHKGGKGMKGGKSKDGTQDNAQSDDSSSGTDSSNDTSKDKSTDSSDTGDSGQV